MLFTIIKAIIMIATLVLNVIYARYHVIRCDDQRRSYPRRFRGKDLDGLKKWDIISCTFNCLMLLLLFFVAFPQLKFFSTNKLVCMVVFFFGEILSYKIYFSIGATLDEDIRETSEYELHMDIYIFGVLLRILVMIIVFCQSQSGGYFYTSRSFLDETQSVSQVEPEEFGETKIIHVKNSDTYYFIYNVEGIRLSKTIEIGKDNVVENDRTYIQVTTTKKLYVNKEYDEESPSYITTVSDIEYKLYLNESDMVEVIVDD